MSSISGPRQPSFDSNEIPSGTIKQRMAELKQKGVDTTVSTQRLKIQPQGEGTSSSKLVKATHPEVPARPPRQPGQGAPASSSSPPKTARQVRHLPPIPENTTPFMKDVMKQSVKQEKFPEVPFAATSGASGSSSPDIAPEKARFDPPEEFNKTPVSLDAAQIKILNASLPRDKPRGSHKGTKRDVDRKGLMEAFGRVAMGTATNLEELREKAIGFIVKDPIKPTKEEAKKISALVEHTTIGISIKHEATNPAPLTFNISNDTQNLEQAVQRFNVIRAQLGSNPSLEQLKNLKPVEDKNLYSAVGTTIRKINEIISTERSYLNAMKALINPETYPGGSVFRVLESQGKMSAAERESAEKAVNNLVMVAEHILNGLEVVHLSDNTQIASGENLMSGLQKIVDFYNNDNIRNLGRATGLCMVKYTSWISISKEVEQDADLKSKFIQPAQRLPRIVMFFDELTKQLEKLNDVGLPTPDITRAIDQRKAFVDAQVHFNNIKLGVGEDTGVIPSTVEPGKATRGKNRGPTKSSS